MAPLLVSAETLQNPQTKHVTIAGDPWPPYLDDRRADKGIAVQLAREALEEEGYQVEMVFVPWARALEGTRTGMFDMIVDAWWDSDRSRDFMFSRPYLDSSIKFIKRKNDPFTFLGLSSLAGKNIALIRGYAYNSDFLASNNYNTFEIRAFPQGISMLLEGRIDLMPENETVARYQLSQQDKAALQQVEFAEKPLSHNLIYAISGYQNPRHTELIDAFNRGLMKLVSSGRYKRLLAENGLRGIFDNAITPTQ
ncbi:amino acid ABC transporter substrate-binding protein [Pokkaliibacter plantistimulans]|uniref:Amino acid ABC transporter substrate-binding protein n=1 Tax=Proteobacteria bacterium 228 TaxID=2083153 RepID=A0A2S5KUL6_9PROT|nr:transporter substrate-binding domain-containing protein [Pokkaliibacter plantistimulans]PPC78209.1 amino acid ABC transporter substrate-binding protein [Pokkaliibacter plantistimulans]